jgi:hypothetical protein
MLSEVGAHTTTQSKHPGAAGCNHADTGSSTEIAHSDRFLKMLERLRELPEYAFFTASILAMIDSDFLPG